MTVPAIANYGELKAKVNAVMHRSDLDNHFDWAMQAAFDEVNNDVISWMNISSATMNESNRRAPGSSEYLLPIRADSVGHHIIEIYTSSEPFVDQFGVNTGSGLRGQTALESQALLRKLRTSDSIQVVPPTNYSHLPALNRIRFSTVPAVDREFGVYYRVLLIPFDDDTETNLLLDWSPQLYLYGMCKHLSIVMQDVDMAAVYQQYYKASVDSVNNYYDRSYDPGAVEIQGASAWG